MARRAVVDGAGKPLRLEDYELKEIPKGKVRIRIAYSGVCRSDLHTRDDNGSNRLQFIFGEERFKQIVPGHEISGYIDDISPELDELQCPIKKGETVIVNACIGCQECLVCQKGMNNLCPDERALLNIGKHPDKPGGYQTHIVVDPKYVFRVPDGVSLQTACLLTCSGGTSYSAVCMLEEAVQFGSDTSKNGKANILIIGAGGLGLWAIRLARALYGEKVFLIVADINTDKLSVAKSAGADEVILWSRTDSNEHNLSEVSRIGPMHGTVDLVGSTTTIFIGVSCLTKSGTIVIAGLEKGEICLPAKLLVLKQISLRGCIVFTMEQLRKLLNLMAEKQIDFPDITTYTLDEVNVALDHLQKGLICGRAVLAQE